MKHLCKCEGIKGEPAFSSPPAFWLKAQNCVQATLSPSCGVCLQRLFLKLLLLSFKCGLKMSFFIHSHVNTFLAVPSDILSRVFFISWCMRVQRHANILSDVLVVCTTKVTVLKYAISSFITNLRVEQIIAFNFQNGSRAFTEPKQHLIHCGDFLCIFFWYC